LHDIGWLERPNIVSALFVPIAIGLAFVITAFSKKYLHKKLTSENPPKNSNEHHV
jgi:hypothetical protein